MLSRGVPNSIADAVSLSIANTLREGLTDIPWLPRPFELDRLSADRAMRRAVALRAAELLAEGKFAAEHFLPIEQVEIPKRNYATRRWCAVVEPMDSVVYLALALLAAPAIETGRIPREENVVYSYRPAPKQGRIFDSAFDIRAFLRASRRQSESGKLVAACDIADFYRHIPPATVERALANAKVEPWLREYLVRLLEFWTDNGADGLPVGSNSSRILAEAVLIPVDRALQAEGIAFSRYVDDFRFFADDPKEAAHAIALTRDLLAREGLSLNPDKTRLWFPESANITPATAAAERENLLHRVGQAGPFGPPPLPRDPRTPDQPTSPDRTRPDQGYRPYDPWDNPFGPTPPGPDRRDDPYPPTYIPDDGGLPPPPLPRRFAPRPRTRTRYSGLVPRYARRPSENELKQFAHLPAPGAKSLLEGELAHTEEVRTAIRQAVFGGHAEFVRALPQLLARYPEFTCYAVSALTKGAEYLPDETRHGVSRALADMLFNPAAESFLKPKLLELISHPYYAERDAIERYARDLSSAPQGMLFRASLDALRKTGGIPDSLHALYESTDAWGRRAFAADAAERGVPDRPPIGAAPDPFLARLVTASSTRA